MLPQIVTSALRVLPSKYNSQFLLRCTNWCSHRFKSYEPDGKTTISILNIDPVYGLMINSFSQIGFRLNNGMAVIGPMAIFPKTVLSWNISGIKDINEDSLSLFCHLEPKIDILVLGTGDEADQNFNKEMIKFMRMNRINLEALPTEQACSTFNFLNAEKRSVAAALVPPRNIRTTDNDIILSKLRHKTLYGVDD